MPFVGLTVAADALPTEVEQALAADVTTLLHRNLGKDPTVTVVSVQLQAPGRWFVDRERIADVTGAHLEVSITAGTNTIDQRAAFLRDAYRMLEDHLGPLPQAVYVAVVELDGCSYGFNGVSQHVRHGHHAA